MSLKDASRAFYTIVSDYTHHITCFRKNVKLMRSKGFNSGMPYCQKIKPLFSLHMIDYGMVWGQIVILNILCAKKALKIHK